MILFPWRSALPAGNENGFVLPVGLIFLAVLAIAGTTGVVMTGTDIQIGTNYQTSTQALYAAEAGIEEARERLRPGSAAQIPDNHKTNANWRVFIGDNANATKKGYDISNSVHVKTVSQYTGADLAFTTVIRHKVNASGNVLYWGDTNGDGVPEENPAGTGRNIYVITTEGRARGAVREIEMEVTALPPITTPAALYVEASTTIHGASTKIIGNDACGSTNKYAISTVLSNPIDVDGQPRIEGSPASVEFNANDLDVNQMVNAYKSMANFSYTVSSLTQTGSESPGPGDNWGTPVDSGSDLLPSSCSEHNIVHYNTGDTYIKFAGGVTGCGILLVEGNLSVQGGFNWYGPILVTGSITFSGGGSDGKKVTGAILAGGSATADLDSVGGNATILYCSDAVTTQTSNMPLIGLAWRDKGL